MVCPLHVFLALGSVFVQDFVLLWYNVCRDTPLDPPVELYEFTIGAALTTGAW